MFTRRLTLPERSFFLLGPRGTGKTTWLRAVLPTAQWYDLLLDREIFRLLRDPTHFAAEVAALPAGSWVVVDESNGCRRSSTRCRRSSRVGLCGGASR